VACGIGVAVLAARLAIAGPGRLAKEFASLRSQRLVFDACDVTVGRTGATASCRGTASYVPKAGTQQSTTEFRRRTFALQDDGEGWVIVRTETRQ
jgi:hypothetical protein